MWRPKNPKDRAVIKLGLWSGLIVWSVFAIALGAVGAQRMAHGGPNIFGTSTWGQVLTFVVPIWIVFTTLLLVYYILKFAGRRLK